MTSLIATQCSTASFCQGTDFGPANGLWSPRTIFGPFQKFLSSCAGSFGKPLIFQILDRAAAGTQLAAWAAVAGSLPTWLTVYSISFHSSVVRALAVWANYKLAVPGSNPGGSILRLCACALVRLCATPSLACALVRLCACALACVLVCLCACALVRLLVCVYSSGFSLLSL